MMNRHGIPRTLIGVGGVRLFNIPGVIYPEEMLHAKAGVKKNDGKPYSTPPPWGITSQEAAKLLGCSVSAARVTMHRNRIHYHLVQDEYSRRLYWKKSQVEKLAAARLPKMQTVPSKLVNTKETMEILGISRSSLQRHYQRGRLKAIHVRFDIPGIGPRRRTYFLKSDVLNFAARLKAMQRRAEELDRLMDEATFGDVE